MAATKTWSQSHFVGAKGIETDRLTSKDAQTYWMSAKSPNQVLLYASAGEPADLETAVSRCVPEHGRARICGLRVEDGCALRYPAWVSGNVATDQIAVHTLDDTCWQACLDAVTCWPTAS